MNKRDTDKIKKNRSERRAPVGVSGGLVARASDSEVGGSILTRVAMNIAFLSKTYYSQKVLVILRKRLFRSDMTKNCLPGRLTITKRKQLHTQHK